MLSCGCAGVPTRPIETGSIATEGVAIAAVDGSFTLTAGAPFRSPFQGQCWNLDDDRPMMGESLKYAAGFALQHGAKAVSVRVPGRPQPLHGVLQLCEAPEAGFGPASRSYRVVVPNDYVAAASDGAISVVYEPVDWRSNAGATMWWYGWILWLSDQPLR